MRGLVEWAQRVVESSRTVFWSRGVWLAVPSPPTLVPVAVLRRVAQRVDQTGLTGDDVAPLTMGNEQKVWAQSATTCSKAERE